MKVIKVNIKEVTDMKAGYDLVEYENGTNPVDGYVLYGFDEVGMFCKDPEYAFVSHAQ